MARTKAAALAAAGGPTPTPSKPSSRNGSGLGSANKNKNENENDTDQKTPIGPLGVTPLPAHAREVVKVNNASVGDLKNACDDAVKRVRIFWVSGFRGLAFLFALFSPSSRRVKYSD